MGSIFFHFPDSGSDSGVRLIRGLCKAGRTREAARVLETGDVKALDLFDRMKVAPSVATYNILGVVRLFREARLSARAVRPRTMVPLDVVTYGMIITDLVKSSILNEEMRRKTQRISSHQDALVVENKGRSDTGGLKNRGKSCSKSRGKLDDEGFCSTFYYGRWKLTKGSMVGARGSKHSSLYITQVKLCDDRIAAMDDEEKAELWHRQLNHISEKGLLVLAKKKLLTGKDVSYDHLCVFGCKAFVHIPKDERSKVDVKSRQCIFTGYGQEQFSYKFYDSVEKKLVRSRDVVFMEDQNIRDIEKSEISTSQIEEEEQGDPCDVYVPEPVDIDGVVTEPGIPVEHGYMKTKDDHCVFVQRFSKDDFIILLTYVEDMLIVGNNTSRINRLKKQLSESFAMKGMGPAKKILGIRIDRDRDAKKLWISQGKYIEKVLQKFNMGKVTVVSSSIPSHFKLSADQSASIDKERKYMSWVLYALVVGSLMYAIVCSRPDIAHAVGVVSRFLLNSGKAHWEAVKWILRYLRGASKLIFCFGNEKPSLVG
ncbi:Retrovirus-related Pol polyprotein from transposon TNT 1-94-like protein [Drosera capensis]